MSLKDFLTINELSQYLNIKKSTLYKMLETGTITRYRVGKLIRFKRERPISGWKETGKKGSLLEKGPLPCTTV